MASGRLASDVVPTNQSKKIYTNSSGGAVTANVHVQALSNTANACLSIRAVNNCAITPTSLVTAAACVCNFIGADSTLSCCGMGGCYKQLQTYFNESDHSICGIHESGRLCQIHGEALSYSFLPACRIIALHYTSSGGCTFFPEHFNGGNDNAACQCNQYNNYNDIHGGRGCICGAHAHHFFPRRGGTSFALPDVNCPTRIFPCFGYVLGFTRTSCCDYTINSGSPTCFSYMCSCGAHHKTTLIKACCFDGKTPDCIMCHQIVDSLRSCPGSLLRCVCHQYNANSEYPSNLSYVAHEPYRGTTIVVASGIGSCSSYFDCFRMFEQTFSGSFGESGSGCVSAFLAGESNTYGCKFNQRLCTASNGDGYHPYLITNGAVVRNPACNGCACNGPALYMWEPGTDPNSNGIKDVVRSQSGAQGQRVCGCRALFWCVGCQYVYAIKWLQWNPTDNNIYIQYVHCNEGGIFSLNWQGGNPVEDDSSLAGVITGSSGYDQVSDPVTDLCGTFCCKCVCYTDLPTCMQTRSPNWFQHMAKDCFVGQWGEKIYRSSDLLTWTEIDCYVCSKVSNATQFQENPSNFSCYFSTDDSCYCYSRNSFNELPCTGIYEYCVSANQLERSGLVLSNNDSLYINNESNTEVSAQVYGYEDS
tara:strand:+ start:250 stop:2184 length:1935 start_codon:yes stop_codon:yes gene_type:complete